MQCITDETGHLLQELSYDTWGNRRDVDTWNVYTTLPAGILLARGFTSHEHIDLFDLINMDGRIYDPVVGRFFFFLNLIVADSINPPYNSITLLPSLWFRFFLNKK